MTLGVSVKTIVNPLTNEALDVLEHSGFETFETNPVNFQTPEFDHGLVEKFIAMKKRTGKTSPTFHAPYGGDWDLSALDENARRKAVTKLHGLFPLAAELETEIIVEHPSGEPVRPEERAERIAQLRKSLADLRAPLLAAGYKLALELLPRTCLGNTAAELLAILDGFGDEFGVCLDVNHLMGRIRELPNEVRLLGDRLLSLHISDYDGVDECHFMPGTCSIDWPPFIKALRDIGYDGVFNYEMRLKGSPADRVRDTIANFTTLFLPLIKKEGFASASGR
jgi:hexosaminidase